MSKLSADQLKAAQHEQWHKAAPGYSKWVIQEHMLQGIMQQYADALQHHFGTDTPIQVLDVASASGEPAITVAKALPRARIVSTDLEEGYLALGQTLAVHTGVQDRVTFETADAEDLRPFLDGTFDALTCSFGGRLAFGIRKEDGLMFMPTLPRALAEFKRVLKPGGVLMVTAWKSLPRWPFLHTILNFCNDLDPEALAGTPPGLATKFGDSALELLEALQAAGFQDIVRRDAEAVFALPANCWWQAMIEMPFPLSKILAKLKQEGHPEADQEVRDKLQAVLVDKGFLQPDSSLHVEGNECHFITARA